MLYIGSFAVVFIIFVISLKYSRKQVHVFFAFFGVLLLMISSMIYSIRTTGVYNSVLLSRLRFIYSIVSRTKISFTDIYRIAIMGNLLIYISTLSITFGILIKKNATLFSLLLIPLSVYALINDPDVSYSLYLQNALFNDIQTELNIITAFNIIISVLYFLMPLSASLIYFYRTSFVVKKRRALLTLLYIMVYYALLFILNSVGLIHFILTANIDLLRYSTTPVSDISLFVVLLFSAFILLAIVLLSVKLSRMQNYSAKTVIKNMNIIDKNLKMILHTYKNRFLGISQQMNYLKSLNEPYSEEALRIIDSIDDFSKTTMLEISERINALQNINVLYNSINLVECADLAITKVFIPDGIKIIREYEHDEAIIFSEKQSITEMIFNLLRNAVEAFNIKTNEENPTIKIKIRTEPDWVLLEVYDNGCGISRLEQRNIFDPLFSAKQGKNNFGIGLHYVKKVVTSHKGYIFVDSQPGRYTSFQIYLPTAPAAKNKIFRKKEGN